MQTVKRISKSQESFVLVTMSVTLSWYRRIRLFSSLQTRPVASSKSASFLSQVQKCDDEKSANSLTQTQVLKQRMTSLIREQSKDLRKDNTQAFMSTFQMLLMFQRQTTSCMELSEEAKQVFRGVIPLLQYDGVLQAVKSLALDLNLVNIYRNHNQPMVLSKSEQELSLLRKELLERSKIVLFSAECLLNVRKRSYMIELAKYWTLLDGKGSTSSVLADVIRKIGNKDTRESRRTFKDIPSDQFKDFCFIVGFCQNLPKIFHKYYVYFKCFDLLDELPLSDLGVAFAALRKHKIFAGRGHPLNPIFYRKILRRLLREDLSRCKKHNLMSILALLPGLYTTDYDDDGSLKKRALQHLMMHKQHFHSLDDIIELFSILPNENQIPSEFLQLLEHALSEGDPHINPLYIGSMAIATKVTSLSKMPEHIQLRLLDFVAQSVKSRLRNESSFLSNSSQYGNVILSLALYQHLDEELIAMVYSCPAFVEQKEDIFLRAKYFFSCEKYLYKMGQKLLQTAALVRIQYPEYKGPMLKDMTYCVQSNDQDISEIVPLNFSKLKEMFRTKLAAFFSPECIYECCLLQFSGSTDFFFAMDNLGNIVPRDDELYLEILQEPSKRTLPKELKWYCITLTDMGVANQDFLKLFDENFSIGYSKLGVKSLAIEHCMLKNLNDDDFFSIIEDLISVAWNQFTSENSFVPGITHYHFLQKRCVVDHGDLEDL